MNEGKRGFKNKKHVVSAEKVKQRNPVAKNAMAGIGGGAAGAHDAKKHTRKDKHKKTATDMMEGVAYDRKLELMLKMSLVEGQLSEASFRDKPGFASDYAQAARKDIFRQIGAGAMRDPSDPIRAKADRAIANRERGLASQGKYYGDKMAAAKAAQGPAPAPDVDAMKAELEKLLARFDDLGQDSYKYADRMTDRDREARDVHHKILSLKGAIHRAEQGVAEGSKFPEPRKPLPGQIPSKSETLGKDGLIYHWQDPRARQGVVQDTTAQSGINSNAKCQVCGTAYSKHFRFDDQGKPVSSLLRHPTKISRDFPDLNAPVAEARANTASVRAGLAKRKETKPLSPEEQAAKDKAKSDKWLEKERAKQAAKKK